MNKFTLIEWNTDKGFGEFKFPCQLDNCTVTVIVDEVEITFDNYKQVEAVIDELVKLKWLLEDAEKETKASTEG